MFSLTRVQDLFRKDAPIPRDALKMNVVEDVKLRVFTGLPQDKLEISFNSPDGDDIILKVVDPQAAAGYLVFQDEQEYNGWLQQELFQPSQDEVEEAASRGSGS
jgi:hypothetical protein